MPPARPTEAAPLPRFAYFAGAILYAAAAAVLAWPWLSGAVTIPWDAKAQFYPQLVFLAKAIHAGDSPFWTPFVFAGWPQIADPQSLIFSAGHLLLALFSGAPGFRAADAVTFATLVAGGIGVILLFRDRGWHPAGAVVAALALSFGGSAAARIQHTGQVTSLALMPIALWLLSRALARGSVWAGAAAGFVAALVALDRDQVALIVLFVLVGCVVSFWIDGPGRTMRLRNSAKPLAAGALTAAVLVTIPFALSALLAAESNRPAMDFVSAGRGSLHPAHLLTLVFADLYGANDPAVDYWGPPSFPWGPTDLFLAQNMGQLYLGLVPLAGIVAAGIARGALGTRDIRFVAIAAVAAGLYMLGWHTPAFRVMFEALPGVSLFRRPADASFVFCGLLAIAGGYCVHRVIADSARFPSLAGALATITGLGLTAAVALYLAHSTGVKAVAWTPVVTGLVFAGAAFATLALARGLARGHALAATALLALVMSADLAWNCGPNESTGLPPATYDAMRPGAANDTIALLAQRVAAGANTDRRDRIELAGIGYHWPNISLIHGLDHLFGHNPLRLAVFARATGVGDTVATPDQRTFSPLFPSYRSLTADLFGLRFIATGVPVGRIDPTLKDGDLALIARTADAYVYENPRALPRVLVVGGAQRADFARLIETGQWPAFDPRRTVLLEREATPASVAAGGSARIAAYGNTDIAIEAEAPEGGFLVLNDVWHPWWRARVNGAPTPVLKANVLFRAVALPKGRSRVVFRFHPFAGAAEDILRRAGLVR